MLLPISQNIKSIFDPRAVALSREKFAKLRDLIEDRMDERNAAALSLEDRGKGIPLKSIVEKYQ